MAIYQTGAYQVKPSALGKVKQAGPANHRTAPRSCVLDAST